MAEGFTFKTTTNLAEVLADFDGFAADLVSIALPLAINKLGEQARVVGLRTIRKRYGLTIADVAPYFDVVPARSGAELEYTIVAKGKGFPMALFKPRVVKGKGGGVSVVLVGRRVLIPHAFMFGGQVFARGSYNGRTGGPGTTGRGAGKRRKAGIRERTGVASAFEPTGETFGRFKFGRRRFPITLLRSTTPPSALISKETTDAMSARIAEQAPAVLRNALRLVARGR